MSRCLILCLLPRTLLCHAQDLPHFAPAFLWFTWMRKSRQNGVLAGLHKEDFLITDNRVPQHVLYFSQDVEPLDLILLFDISGSMRPKLEKVAASSRRALAELSPGDRVAVMTFHGNSAIVAGFTEDLNAVARTINDEVLGGRFGGGTHLLAAVDDAAEYFLREPRTNGAARC